MSRAAQRPLNRNVVLVRADHQHDVAGNLAAGDHAREHGGRVVALMMPLRVESRMNFRSGVILDSRDGWSGPMALPLAEKMALLGNADERRRLEALAAPTAATRAWANWWSLEILETYSPETSRYEGRVVGDAAAAAGQAPFDTLVEIALTDRLLTTFGVRQPPDTLADWEVRAAAIRDPRAVVGASDAGAHLDMFALFNYTTRFLAEGVRTHQVMSFGGGPPPHAGPGTARRAP